MRFCCISILNSVVAESDSMREMRERVEYGKASAWFVYDRAEKRVVAVKVKHPPLGYEYWRKARPEDQHIANEVEALELSQFTSAKSAREIDLENLLRDALAENAELKAGRVIADAAFEALKKKMEAVA